MFMKKWLKENKRNFFLDGIKLLKILLVWRLVLLLFQAGGIRLLSFNQSFPYVKELLKPLGPQFIWQWANFDGVHYLTIIEKGYLSTGFIQAFFPLYPFLARIISWLVGNPLISGLLLSHLCLAGVVGLLYALTRLDYSKQTAKKTVAFFLIFPTSFFLAALYSESLFLLLILLAFWLMRKKLISD